MPGYRRYPLCDICGKETKSNYKMCNECYQLLCNDQLQAIIIKVVALLKEQEEYLRKRDSCLLNYLKNYIRDL